MATVAEIQAELDPQGTKTRIQLLKQYPAALTYLWYATGGVDAVGKARWVTTTIADNAATQAAAITTAMQAQP
jgi:hypothetical protein